MDSRIFLNSPITFHTLYLLKASCQPIKWVLSINAVKARKIFLAYEAQKNVSRPTMVPVGAR